MAATPTTAAGGVTSDFATSGPGNLQPAAAGETIISGEELNARAASRVGEVLEAVPGLMATQHSGAGHAAPWMASLRSP